MAITKSIAATARHIRAVLSDPDYVAEYNKLVNHPEKNKLLPVLLKRYGLELDDFNMGNRNNGFALYINPHTMFSAGDLEYVKESREFVARFDETIRKEQFKELWDLIMKNKARHSIPKAKQKPPEEDTLLYAIFKARMKNRTFNMIFIDYQNGALPLYNGKSNSKYHTEDELEKYYRKFYKTEL